MEEKIYLTKEGLDNLKEELHRMKTVERTAISRQIAEAREKGDLSENAEYDAAKEAQGLLEMKIAKTQTMLANARLIDETKIDNSKVMILSKVTLKNLKTNSQVVYTLVSEKESDLKAGKISLKSPIGSALIGKVVGDVVEVKVPAGILNFEILDISRA